MKELSLCSQNKAITVNFLIVGNRQALSGGCVRLNWSKFESSAVVICLHSKADCEMLDDVKLSRLMMTWDLAMTTDHETDEQ